MKSRIWVNGSVESVKGIPSKFEKHYTIKVGMTCSQAP
jgi:hypothetical protein